MRKIFFPLFALGAAAIICNVVAHSDQPVAASTGAPSENTCVRCHTGMPVNQPDGSLELNFSNNSSFYQLDKEYNISIKASKESISTFGFEVVALQKSMNKNIGTFVITDTGRTQAFAYAVDADSRTYVGHTKEGTKANIAGSNSWTFKWISPATDAGDVVFYAAAVMSNTSGNRFGDQVHTVSLTVSSEVTASEAAEDAGNFKVFAIEGNAIEVSYRLSHPAPVYISLTDSKGMLLQILKSKAETAGNISEQFAPNYYLPGIYFVQFHTQGKSVSRKIVL